MGKRIRARHLEPDNPFMPAPWMPDTLPKRVLALAFIAFVCVGYSIILMGLLGR